jgi:hypothetical protein
MSSFMKIALPALALAGSAYGMFASHWDVIKTSLRVRAFH